MALNLIYTDADVQEGVEGCAAVCVRARVRVCVEMCVCRRCVCGDVCVDPCVTTLTHLGGLHCARAIRGAPNYPIQS